MKKSKLIHLVLVTSLFVACGKREQGRKVYLRTDTTGVFEEGRLSRGSYFYFYPYSTYSATNRNYNHQGYHNTHLGRYSSGFFRYTNFRPSSTYSSSKSYTYSGGSSRGGFGGGGFGGG